MRLALTGLPQSRSQACRFVQALQFSPFDIEQPHPKRRRLQPCSCYSTDSGNGGEKSPGLNNRAKASSTAWGALSKAAQLPRERARETRDTQVSTSPPDNVLFRKTRVGPGSALRPSVVPSHAEGQARNWKLSVEKLEAESDVGHSLDVGTKLVDDPRCARDVNLWMELLLYRQRHYGDRGTIDIWKGMRERCVGMDVPVVGDIGRLFWRSFVNVGLKRESFLIELMEYAQDAWERRGKKWHGFYAAVVGGYLERGSVRKALKWHWLLKDTHMSQPNDILRIFRPALLSKNGLKAFKAICRTVEGHSIYSSVVPLLWQRHMVDDALSIHHLLVRKGDGPRTIQEVEPLIRHVRIHRSKKERLKFLQEMIESGTANRDHWLQLLRHGGFKLGRDKGGDKTDVSKQEDPHTPSNDNGRQTRFTDDFGARLFATKPFSLELILAGMHMFSVQAIGPLTLRQMAMRAGNAEEVAHQIQALQKAGISIGNSVFSRVVQKLVADGDSRTLQDLLHSDQHPDVLEDLGTQELLLSSYTLSQDWRQANKTYVILSVLSDEDPYNFNIQFRNAVNTARWSATTELIEKMKDKNVVLSQRSVKRMTRTALPPRRPGRRPRQNKVWSRALWHLLGTLQHVSKCGGNVSPRSWREGLKRLGMSGRWEELEKLCLWLADFYSTSSTWHPDVPIAVEVSTGSQRQKPSQLAAAQTRSALAAVFSLPLLQAIIAWGFTVLPAVLHKAKPLVDPWSETEERLIPWVRGLVLLRQLEEKGVVIHDKAVQKACRQRLAVLYGRYRHSNRRKNRALRKGNPYKLEGLLNDMDKAWGRPLFPGLYGMHRELVNPRIRTLDRFENAGVAD